MRIERTCISCDYWRFDAGSEGYSELTPGWNWSSYCGKNHWSADGVNESEEGYRDKLLTAGDCKDFEQRKVKK
jgi:hypothetical protein